MSVPIPTETARAFAEAPAVKQKALGDSGLSRFGGVIHDPDLRRLVGNQWRRVIGEMLRTPQVGAMVFAINQLVRRAEWSIEPADESTEAQGVADLIEGMRGDMAVGWEDILSELLLFLPYGFDVHEIVYKRRLGDATGVMARSAYTDGLIAWADWAPRPQDTITRWVYDATGALEAVVQRSPMVAGDVTIPLSKCLHLVNAGGRRSPEGLSVLVPAFTAWKAIRHIQYYEAVGIERELAGYPYVTVPGDILSDPTKAEIKRSYEELVQNVRLNEQAGAVLPSDVYPDTKTRQYELHLVSTGGQRSIDTNVVIRRYQAELVETVLAGFLTIGHGTTGTYALASEKTRLFGLALQSWLDAIAEAVTQQAIRRVVALNGWDQRLAPTLYAGAPDNADLARDGAYFKHIQPVISRLDPEDLEALAKHLFALADWPLPEKPLREPAPAVVEREDGADEPEGAVVKDDPNGNEGDDAS